MTHVTKFVIGGKVKKEIRKELDVELDAVAELDDIPNPQEEILDTNKKCMQKKIKVYDFSRNGRLFSWTRIPFEPVTNLRER